MRKLILLAGLLAARAASADVMYWQVGADTAKDYPTACEARLRVVGVDEAVQYAFVSAEASPAMTRTAFDLDTLGAFGVDEPTALSFCIELYSYDAESGYVLEAYSAAATYEALKGFMASSIMSVPLDAWGGGTFTAVPEPTSGMLLLVGMGLVALRRRREPLA